MSISSANRSLQLVMRLLDTKNATAPMVDFGPQKPEIPLERRSSPLPRSAPEQQGIPSRHIAEFLHTLDRDPGLNMHSVVIVRNGVLVCEAAFGAQLPELPRMTFSACKSITALAIGLLMDDGLLHEDDRLSELFAQDCGPVSRRLIKELTVSHLLTMQTGNLFNEASSMTSEDWVRGFFQSPSLTDPRGKLQYNSLNTYILAVLVTRLTGKSLSAFLTERLFAPMGIADFYWETSPQGIEKGGWGLYMRAEDLAKLGQLVLDHGMWNGRQLISWQFLSKATTAHMEAPRDYGAYNYGWQMWVGREENTVLFNGMLGQNVLCFRDSGIVVVSHAGNSETFQQSSYFRHASRFFGGTFPRTLRRNRTAERELTHTLQHLTDCTSPLPDRANLRVFDGVHLVPNDPRAASTGLLPLTLQAVENCYCSPLCAVTLHGQRSSVSLRYEEQDAVHQVFAGINEPTYQVLQFGGNEFRCAAQARFTHDEDDNPLLRIRIDFLETPCSRILKFFRTPTGWRLKQEETPGVEYVLNTMTLAAPSPSTKAWLTNLLGSSDTDYLRWKIAQVFSPTLQMKQTHPSTRPET